MSDVRQHHEVRDADEHLEGRDPSGCLLRERALVDGPLVRAEILHVHERHEPDVVGQVPAIVIGIFVDDNLIGIPQPIVGVRDVVRCDAEVKAVEPEARRAAPDEVKYMRAAEASGEAAVLPRMIEMIVGIVAAGIVASRVRDSSPSRSNR